MSIFGNIVSAILGHSTSSAPGSAVNAPPAQPAAPGQPAPTPSQPAASAQAAPMSAVDVAAVMDKLAAQSKEKLDWRKSIVDLMKLLNLDSSLGARKELAQELHFTGNTNDSASMNIWLHQQVMTKLAENGGKVPAELRG
jgi:hypothetical protein